jgi:3',5'-cyclic AMP phosphodiesterase CpdA
MTPANHQDPSAPVHLAHLSDIHIGAKALWRVRDWFSKRFTGWVNLHFGRASRFRHAEQILAALVQQLRHDPPSRIIFSGDATTLGFAEEFARAVELLGVNGADALPGIAVPGNHDYYTRGVAASGLFEKHFHPWLAGRRVDEATYPFAQRVGRVWLVGVNSCTGNRWPWDAAGSVGNEQLARLDTLLQHLEPGPRILVTHYPVCLSSGAPERPHHWLRDVDAVLKVAIRGGVCLWLHGHRHRPYDVAAGVVAPFPVICAGSATQEGCWSYRRYTIEGSRLKATRQVYSPVSGVFEPADAFKLSLGRN